MRYCARVYDDMIMMMFIKCGYVVPTHKILIHLRRARYNSKSCWCDNMLPSYIYYARSTHGTASFKGIKLYIWLLMRGRRVCVCCIKVWKSVNHFWFNILNPHFFLLNFIKKKNCINSNRIIFGFLIGLCRINENYFHVYICTWILFGFSHFCWPYIWLTCAYLLLFAWKTKKQ